MLDGSTAVGPLDPRDAPAAAVVLARAFQDNPGMLAMFPDDAADERLRLLTPCMEGFVASVVRYGVAEAVKLNGRVVSVSLSFGPGAFPPPFFATILQAKGPLRAGARRALRFARVDQQMRKRHPHDPHWYLWFLGVEPEQQGKGLGSQLLRALSARAEADRVPCYLETDKPSSVKLYEGHGYRVESADVLPGFNLKLWFMRRPHADGSGPSAP